MKMKGKIKMRIDRSKKICKTIAIFCAVSVVITFVFGIKSISTFQLMNMLACAAIGWICYNGTTKDKEIIIGIYGALTVYQMIRMLTSENSGMIGAVVWSIILLGYAGIVAYLMKWTENKSIITIGAFITSVLHLHYIVPLVIAYMNLLVTFNNVGARGSSWFNLVGKTSMIVCTYTIPALAMGLLLKSNALEIDK